MTKFENSLSIIQEKVWLENSLSQLEGGRRGRGGSGYIAGSERVTTHMEAATILKFSHYTPTCL